MRGNGDDSGGNASGGQTCACERSLSTLLSARARKCVNPSPAKLAKSETTFAALLKSSSLHIPGWRRNRHMLAVIWPISTEVCHAVADHGPNLAKLKPELVTKARQTPGQGEPSAVEICQCINRWRPDVRHNRPKIGRCLSNSAAEVGRASPQFGRSRPRLARIRATVGRFRSGMNEVGTRVATGLPKFGRCRSMSANICSSLARMWWKAAESCPTSARIRPSQVHGCRRGPKWHNASQC